MLCDRKLMAISEHNAALIRVKLKEFKPIWLEIFHYRRTSIISTICQIKITESAADKNNTN
jgi:hypothetical protein